MPTELYGTFASLTKSQATTPISTATNVVFIGAAKCQNGDGDPLPGAPVNEPTIITSISDYAEKFGGAIGDGWSLSEAVEAAFSMCNLSHIYVINVFDPENMNDEGDVTESDIIGSAADQTGCYAIQKMYPEHGAIANIVCCPLSSSAAVVAAMKANVTKANGHWDGIVVYDCAEAANQVNARRVAQIANISKTASDERLIANWPHIKSSAGNVISGAAYKACLYAQTDAENNGIPKRSIGNLRASGVSYLCLKASPSDPIILEESAATQLSADGITSFINIGGGIYYTWGDHTSEFSNGSVSDERARFDSNIRMLLSITNRFQQKWRNAIDAPMDLGLRNDILTEEQTHLDYLVSQGGLIGSPLVEFRAVDNTLNTLQQGEFYFRDLATVTPPAKVLDLKTTFTSDGFKVYLV